MKHTITSMLITLPMLAFLSGPSLAGAPTSTFITDIPALQPVPAVEGAWGWEKEQDILKGYDKFMLVDVEVMLAADSPYKGINARQLKAITDTMRALIVKEMEPDYPIVSQAGPGVAQWSMAITNVKISKRKKNLMNYTPPGLIAGSVRRAADALTNISLANAVVEAEFTDSVTGERLGVRVATKPWAQAEVSEGKMSWETLEAAFEYYVKMVRKRADQARAGK